MRVKGRHGSGENHERWLVSYADFITLLFAFFVVLFASTQSDKTKAKQVSQAVDRALREGAFAPKVTPVRSNDQKSKGSADVTPHGLQTSPLDRPDKPGMTPAPDLAASMQVLASELRQEIKDQKVKLKLEERGLIVGLEEAAFFASGEDAIKPTSYPILEKLARVLGELPNPLRLEGHTDSIPIYTVRFRNNWELSAARSIAMLRLLNERFRIQAGRMAVVGYADTDASEPDVTPEGRARNRRVDIVIVSQYGMQAEPQRLHSLGSAKKN
jgi:chemotaxis protein MotB